MVDVEALHAVFDINPIESENIFSWFAFEYTQATPQSFLVNAVALANIDCIERTRDTSHLEISALKTIACWNIEPMCVTRDTSHLEMSALKDVAEWNIWPIFVTRDTSQLEMSALNAAAS